MGKHVSYFVGMAVSAMLCLGSCEEKDPSYHVLAATSYASGEPIVFVYADQLCDTVSLRTTDPWTAATGCNWLLFAESGKSTHSGQMEYEYGVEKIFVMPMTLEANTGSALRHAMVKFTANGRNAGLQYVQLYHMNVSNPAPKYADASSFTDATFTKKVAASAASVGVSFTLYADATLSTEQGWVSVPETSFTRGTHDITLTLQPNTSGADRTADITILSSTGAKTVIAIVQERT